MRVLICGDRNWTDYQFIKHSINIINQIWSQRWPSKEKEFSIECIIEGECRGADKMAAFAAGELGIKIEPYPAEWNIHGKAAGPIRNQQMLDKGKPDLVIAFHNNIEQSVGTADMIKRAKKAGIETWILKSQ